MILYDKKLLFKRESSQGSVMNLGKKYTQFIFGGTS